MRRGLVGVAVIVGGELWGLLALITDSPNVARFLRPLDEPTELPPRAPARDPRFTQSRERRRRHDEHSAQRELFEEH